MRFGLSSPQPRSAPAAGHGGPSRRVVSSLLDLQDTDAEDAAPHVGSVWPKSDGAQPAHRPKGRGVAVVDYFTTVTTDDEGTSPSRGGGGVAHTGPVDFPPVLSPLGDRRQQH